MIVAVDVEPGSGGRLRHRVYALLAVLTAMWAFGAFVAVQEAVQVFRAHAVGANVGQPTDAVIGALQEERRLSVTFLAYPGGGGEQRHAALLAQRSRTDEAAARLQRLIRSGYVRLAAGTAGRKSVDRLVRRLATLSTTREAVDTRRLDRDQASAAYTELIDTAFGVYGSSWLWPEPQLVTSGRALVALTRARELLAQEDTFVRGALATGRLSDADRARLGQLVGAQRVLHREAVTQLPAAAADRYQRLAGQAPFIGLRAVEDRLVETDGPGAATPVGVDAWSAVADPVLAALDGLVRVGVRDTVDAATPAAVETVVYAGLVGGLGLVAIVTAIVVSVRITRAAPGQPRQERGSAAEPPPERLPSSTEHPGPVYDLFLDLSQRNQALLHQQLRLLDTMERQESDADGLADLFQVDHLATRMRRNVEKLILLNGAVPGRRWRYPVPMIDVVRGAVAEVEQYQRVDVSSIESAALSGPAVPDVTHLLAELIENATVFSPVDTTVWVSGRIRPDGYAVMVKDHGPGISGADLATAHDLIADRTSPTAGALRGLYAAGRFARRHDIRVELRNGPRGGVTAEVLIPFAVVIGGLAGRVRHRGAFPHDSGGGTGGDTEPANTLEIPTVHGGSGRPEPSGEGVSDAPAPTTGSGDHWS